MEDTDKTENLTDKPTEDPIISSAEDQAINSSKCRKVKKRKAYPHIIGFVMMAVGALILCVTLFLKLYADSVRKGRATILTSSTLTETINIAELSTAEFTYNGIAQKFREGSTDDPLYSIRYNAVVKAVIDMAKVRFDINEEEKIITPVLPEIEITVLIVGDKPLTFVPDHVDIALKDAISLCEQDALSEAMESGELYRIAEENLKDTIEALTYPIVSPQGYTIEWK